MFSFLNTSILIGVVAAAIPLIIHLLTRQKVKKVFFSSLIFLKELQTRQIRRIKIRQILLLIIRTLIILLLFLAFARPTYRGKLSTTVQSRAKTSAVIIFDNSMSMGREQNGKMLIDEAKERVTELAELFRVGDEIYSLTAIPGAPPVYDGPRYDFKNVIKHILKLKVSSFNTDFATALLEAKNILQQSKNLNKEIYLITDLQKTGFKDIPPEILATTKIKLFIIPCVSSALNNLGIIKVESANQIIEKGKVFKLNVVIKNTGDYEENNKLVQLFIEGRRSAQGIVNLKPHESQQLTFKIVPDSTGLLSGSVLLEDDDLLLDNRRYFTFYVPDVIKVLLVGRNTRYLELVADISPNIEIDVADDNFNSVKDYNLVIMSNVPKMQGSQIASLYDFVQQGGGLILFLGSEVDLKDYNTNFNPRFNLPAFTETIGDINKHGSFLTFEKIDYSHPIFSDMFENNKKQVDSPRFYFAIGAKLNRQTQAIINFSNGKPFLTETKVGKGKVLLFLTSIDPGWSDFYIKGIFVPLINRSIIYLAGMAEKAQQGIFVGQEIKCVAPTITNLKIEKPDGSFKRIKPLINKGNYNVSFTDTDMSGIYTLYSNNKQLDKWAVNFWPQESNFEQLSIKNIKHLVGNDNVIVAESKEDVLKSRYGQELWKYFITVVLILLILEMIIGREPKKQTI